MILKVLLSLGLVCVPFFRWSGFALRSSQMAIALVFALILSLVAFYTGQIKPFKNKWLLIFLASLAVSFYFKPNIIFPDISIIPNFFIWQPLFYISIFFMLLIVISSIKFESKEIKIIFNIITGCGFVMALYVIVQYLNIEQFFELKNTGEVLHTPQANLTGTLGHPTIVAPFIAMLIPIAFYCRKRLIALYMIFAVSLTLSKVALAAMIFSLLYLLSTKGKIWLLAAILLTVSVLGVFGYGYFNNPKIKGFLCDSGRFAHWQQLYEDVNTAFPKNNPEAQRYSLTGFGMGSFHYFYPNYHKNNFGKAHNDYLELLFNAGHINLILFVLAILTMIQMVMPINHIYKATLVSSFIAIALAAGGTFVWQLGPHIFYTIFICGLLHNESFKEGGI